MILVLLRFTTAHLNLKIFSELFVYKLLVGLLFLWRSLEWFIAAFFEVPCSMPSA